MSMVDPEGRGLPLNMRHVARRSLSNVVPTATNPAISGGAIIGVQQTGTYTYGDADGDVEGTSTYRWLRDGVAIGGATAITYTPLGSDYGHTLTFEVTPRAATGLSPGVAATSAGSVVTFTSASVPNQVAWYDLADISTLWKDTARTLAVSANGDIIKGVTDKSTSGFHLSEATNGPTYTTGAQNGKSAAAFDGTNDQLSSAAFTLSQPNTLLIVAKVTAHSAAKSERFVDAVTARQLIFSNSGGNWAYFAGSSQIGSIASDTSYHQFTVIFNGASSAMRVDAASNSTGNPGANALTSLKLGVDNAFEFYNIQIGEWLAYSGSLSSTNRDSYLEPYLKTKWGTP